MTNKKHNALKIMLLMPLLVLSACTYGKVGLKDGAYSQAEAIKQQGGMYKVGNPYKVLGSWYYPKEDYSYSEVGISSWYGEDFHAKKTANGENYDMNTLTAAHRTLPIPSIIKVTNLENGRSLVLRVNDRGPYAKSRIIDVSKRAAGLLGFQAQGTAKVRVELMEKESKELKAALLGEECPPIPSKPSPIKVAETSKPKPLELTGYTGKVISYPKGSYFVQAGAYSNQSSAQTISSKLDKYAKTNIYQVDVDGRKLYRVRLGPFAHEQEAHVALARVKNYGIDSAAIVKD